jgi:glycosyltransferase involved in cell wall biosynthesis
MNMNIEVSVLLPTYNGSRFIKNAIRSVLKQDLKNLELIVIDDCSTDNTSEIINEFKNVDNRIVHIRNDKNLGIQKTLNRGLSIAIGQYIARIDDDDEWVDLWKLSKQVQFFKDNPDHVLVGTGTIVVDEDKTRLFRFLQPITDAEIRGRILFKNCFTHSGVLFRKDDVLNLGGYSEEADTLHVEDYDLWLKLGALGKMAGIPIYAVEFMIRLNAISSKNKVIQLRNNIHLIKKYRRVYEKYSYAIILGYIRLILYGFFRILPNFIRRRIFSLYKKHY